LNDTTAVTIDAKNVKRIDTAGLQLLCCWFLETKKKGISVVWQNTQGKFYESAMLLGLAEVMEI
jgi:ABC-type transporter Mla MlaB component